MKKFILLSLIVPLLTVFLFAAEGQSATDWHFEVQDDETAVITAYNGTDSEADIPEDGSRVTQVYESLLDEEGQPGTFHMSYRVDFLKTGNWYTCEAFIADGSVYRTMENHGTEDISTKMFREGMEYDLNTEEKTGTVIKAFPETSGGGFFLEDELYKQLSRHAHESEYTVQRRIVNGETYIAEIFPENRYFSERAFYFNEEGKLEYYYEDDFHGSNPSGRSEVLITIYDLDQSVDQSVFDISDYEITPLPDREPLYLSPSGN